MNLQQPLSTQDAPKLAITGVLILTTLLGVHFAIGRVNAGQERARTIRHMNLEMGRGPDADTSQVPESIPGTGDPNFIW